MNRREEIQYIADTFLIERLSEMYFTPQIKRMAQLSEIAHNGMVGIKSSLESMVKDSTDFSSPEATVKSVLKLLTNFIVPSMLWRISPFFALFITTAEQIWNFNISNMWDKLLTPVKSKLESGQPVEPSDISPDIVSVNSADDMKIAYDIFYNINKTAWGKSNNSSSNSSMFDDFIKNKLGQEKSTNIVLKFLSWVIRTVIISAGLMAISGAVSNIISPKKEETPTTSNTTQTPYQTNTTTNVYTQTPTVNLQPSGQGEQYHPNNADSVWIVPLYGGNMGTTLLEWATQVYPELEGQESIIQSSPKFNQLSNILGSYIDSDHPNYLVVPHGYNRIKDMVDIFAGDIANKIKGNGYAIQ